MICNNCGFQLSDLAKFCSSCGHSTAPTGWTNTNPIPETQFLAPIQPYQQQTSSLPSQGLPQYQPTEVIPPYAPQVYQYQVPVHIQGYYVKRKEPVVALLLSLFIPGVGQIYNGDVGKGIAFMIGFFSLVWVGIGIVFWVWAMIDAYQVANNINYGRRT